MVNSIQKKMIKVEDKNEVQSLGSITKSREVSIAITSFRRFNKDCYNYWIRGHIVWFCCSKRYVVEGNAITSSQQQDDDNKEECELHTSSCILEKKKWRINNCNIYIWEH